MVSSPETGAQSITHSVDSPTKTRILMVEDFEPYRRFVSSLLKDYAGLEIIAEAFGGFQAVEMARELKPDLVLFDIGIPQLNGIEAAKRIRSIVPQTKIIFLTQEHAPDIVEEAANLGASAYILKSEAELHLIPALKAVIAGKTFFNGKIVINNHNGNRQHPKE